MQLREEGTLNTEQEISWSAEFRSSRSLLAGAPLALAGAAVRGRMCAVEKQHKRELDPVHWVDEYGDYLFRYALSRLRDCESAEEAVQETFVAGLSALAQYSGKGAERAWLLGILKRKVIDLIRGRSKFTVIDLEDEISERLFKSNGRWKSDPRIFGSQPEAEMERAEFWHTLQACLDGLPLKQRDVFTLREVEDMNAKEICSSLGISRANLWVLLHRARLRLADCMKTNWAGTTT